MTSAVGIYQLGTSTLRLETVMMTVVRKSSDWLMLILLWDMVVFTLIAWSVRNGSLWAVGATLLASTVPMAAASSFIERRNLNDDVFNPEHASWAFVFGDALCLPFAAAMMTLAWRKIDHKNDAWQNSIWWLVLSIAIGIVAALAFRYLPDYNSYVRGNNKYHAKAVLEFKSPTKLLHDFGAYPVLFGSFVYVGFPVLLKGAWTGSGYLPELMLVALLIWLTMGVTHDASLDPRKLHPAWDWNSGAPVSNS